MKKLRKKVVPTELVPSSTPTPSPTPTPRPLTLAEMNLLYGPCVRMPALMYHHTWSHKNVAVSQEVLERGLNSSKVFAYPYGLDNRQAISL